MRSYPDELEIVPLGAPPEATIRVPGSRSITNRALVCAALAAGTSTLSGVLDSDDTRAMLGCLTSLGVEWRDLGDHTIEVDGCGGAVPPGPASLHTRLSGTTSRFVTAMCASGTGDYTIDADGPMRTRPMGDLVRAFRDLGVEVNDTDGHLPITVHATGGLAGGPVELPGDVSSQFTSALMLVSPCTSRGISIGTVGGTKSQPYLDMTASVRDRFAGAGGYRATTYAVEPDASTACYFWAAGAIGGGNVQVEGLGAGSIQGDVQFRNVLAPMGRPLHGIEVDLSDMSDQAPTFGVVAAFAEGTSRATGVGFIRRKESDRIAAVVEGLRTLGVEAHEEDDGFTVVGCGPGGPPHGGRIHTYDDHRIAMSFALAGLRTPGVIIGDPGCVSKTFPEFFDVLESLRGSP